MTVRELKEKLEQFPDDYEVYVSELRCSASIVAITEDFEPGWLEESIPSFYISQKSITIHAK